MKNSSAKASKTTSVFSLDFKSDSSLNFYVKRVSKFPVLSTEDEKEDVAGKNRREVVGVQAYPAPQAIGGHHAHTFSFVGLHARHNGGAGTARPYAYRVQFR